MNVTVENKGDLLLEARCGGNKILIDLPRAVGGKDRGMTPTELMAVALASCANAMIAKRCKEKSLDSTGVKVRMDYEHLDNPARLGKMKVIIKLTPALEEHRAELLKVAQACPVHATMHDTGEVEFVFE